MPMRRHAELDRTLSSLLGMLGIDFLQVIGIDRSEAHSLDGGRVRHDFNLEPEAPRDSALQASKVRFFKTCMTAGPGQVVAP